MKVAVIVNDMSEVNIDASLVRKQSSLSRTEEKLVEMTNGCICCTLREDLLSEVGRIADEGKYDYILIESTGIGEPIPVAQTFTFTDEANNIDLSSKTRLDCMVTVVDARNFLNDYMTAETLKERNQGISAEDERTVVDLLTDQIEFCDVLIVNKCDLVNQSEMRKIETILKKLQPTAKYIQTKYGKIDPNDILDTWLFDFERASRSAGWIKELTAEHTPETEEYNISSFVYRRERPFHPSRLYDWMNYKWPTSVIRSKGYIWTATRNSYAISFSQAGQSIHVDFGGEWIAELDDDLKQAFVNEEPDLKSKLEREWGDRETELVFIGIGIPKDKITTELDECLLSDKEMTSDWKSLRDPLPEIHVERHSGPTENGHG
jgi:G3E family GTPase